jgi:hypothetical protein
MSLLRDTIASDSNGDATQFAEGEMGGEPELDPANTKDIVRSGPDFWHATCKAVFEGQKEINAQVQRRSIAIHNCGTSFKLRGTYRRPGRPNKATLAWHPEKNYIDISMPKDRKGPRVYAFTVSNPKEKLFVRNAFGGELDSSAVAAEFLDFLTGRKS